MCQENLGQEGGSLVFSASLALGSVFALGNVFNGCTEEEFLRGMQDFTEAAESIDRAKHPERYRQHPHHHPASHNYLCAQGTVYGGERGCINACINSCGRGVTYRYNYHTHFCQCFK